MKLVQAHAHAASRVAAGLAHLPDTATPFAATQAAWRFFRNPDVSLPALVEPLRQAARQALTAPPATCALLVHDWCKLDYARHCSKTDLAQLTHQQDIGYELLTALLVDARTGAPLAPVEIQLETAAAVHSTRTPPPPAALDHLSQVLPTMQAAQGWGLPVPLIHIIDREADSVGHYRQWDAGGFAFVVRGDDRLVLWQGRECLLSRLADTLQQGGAFHAARDVRYHGKKARQEVAETEVVLHRPARQRDAQGKQHAVPGAPLTLRLVVTRVYDEAGRLLAQWYLLTNVAAATADADTIALWYYWRWRIESYHKLLKSAGHEIEHWQQESGLAIAKRLLVAAMACVVVWQLERTTTAEAEELKEILIALSGRQMKHKCDSTAPALLAGLHVLLAMLSLLEQYDLENLRRLAQAALPFNNSG